MTCEKLQLNWGYNGSTFVQQKQQGIAKGNLQ